MEGLEKIKINSGGKTDVLDSELWLSTAALLGKSANLPK